MNLTVTKHYNLKTLKITGEIATADMEAVLMLPEHLKKLHQGKKATIKSMSLTAMKYFFAERKF